jgi:hypothetical protein
MSTLVLFCAGNYQTSRWTDSKDHCLRLQPASINCRMFVDALCCVGEWLTRSTWLGDEQLICHRHFGKEIRGIFVDPFFHALRLIVPVECCLSGRPTILGNLYAPTPDFLHEKFSHLQSGSASSALPCNSPHAKAGRDFTCLETVATRE